MMAWQYIVIILSSWLLIAPVRHLLGAADGKTIMVVEEMGVDELLKWHDIHFETLMTTEDWAQAVVQADKGVFAPARMSLAQALEDAEKYRDGWLDPLGMPEPGGFPFPAPRMDNVMKFGVTNSSFDGLPYAGMIYDGLARGTLTHRMIASASIYGDAALAFGRVGEGLPAVSGHIEYRKPCICDAFSGITCEEVGKDCVMKGRDAS